MNYRDDHKNSTDMFWARFLTEKLVCYNTYMTAFFGGWGRGGNKLIKLTNYTIF